MGSYDTGEVIETPRRSSNLSRETDNSGRPDNMSVPGAYETQASTTPSSSYIEGAPLLISLGGGLTPSRIVKKIPEEYGRIWFLMKR